MQAPDPSLPSGAYRLAQRALADLKVAVYDLLSQAPTGGLSNSAIGRTLGIYHGHVGHEGHIPRTLLAIMESEGVVEQDTATKKWRLRQREANAESSDPRPTASGSQAPEPA